MSTVPRAPRRVEESEEVESPLQLAGQDLETGEGESGAELNELLAGLQGGARYFGTVYRQDDSGGEQFLPGRLVVNPDEAGDELLERLYKAHGPGRYHLQIRAQGSRGTKGNAYVNIGGAPIATAVAPSATPTSSRDDTLREMLRESRESQNQLLKLLIERAAPPPAAAPQSMTEVMKQVGEALRLVRTASREQSVPALPGWIEQIGQVAAPFLAALANGLNTAAARIEQTTPALPRRPEPHASPTAPAHAPTAEGAASSVAAPSAGSPPTDPPSPAALACSAMAMAELKQAAPDAARLALGMWSIAAREIGELLGKVGADVLAAGMAEADAAFKGHEAFARDVARELELLKQQTAPPATPATEAPHE
jgi:hypothetical protein